MSGADGAGRRVAPTPQQSEAIHAPLGAVRIIAGAGSGKTSVMAERIAVLIERGHRPDQILGLTFSNKAAENLRERVARRVGGGIDVAISTYHGFGASIVNESAELLGFERTPKLLDRASAFQLLYAALDEVTLEQRRIGRVAHLASAALRLASQCSDHLVSVESLIADCDRLDTEDAPEKVRNAARGRRDLARLVEVYARTKRERGFIDFGDQIALAVHALEVEPLRAHALLARHPIVLLDEYQDTNYAQRRLLQQIYPRGSAVTAVGDDMQAIYAFRGSHLRNIFDFAEHFATEDAPVVEAVLTVNFRSGPDVVAVANAVHRTVRRATEKALDAAPENAPAIVETVVCADELDEAATIAEWIAARGAPWGGTAVLGRKRKIFPLIADALTARGIPVEIIGIGGLLTRPEIVDVVAWLEVLALDDADVAALRLLRSPLRNVGLRDLAALAQHSAQVARARFPDIAHPVVHVLHALDDVDAVDGMTTEAWVRVKALQNDRRMLLRRVVDLALPDLLDTIIDVERLRDRADAVIAENLLRFTELAATFEPLDGAPTVRSFLDYLQLLLDGEDEPAEAVTSGADAVRVMSIHQAKGLEYDNVVLAGLAGSKKSSSIFPDERLAENGATQMDVLPLWLRDDNDGITDAPRTKAEIEQQRLFANAQRADEERRLLYVAVTRARRRLLCSTGHWYSGPQDPQGPSEFFELIDAQKAHVRPLRSRAAPAPENPMLERKRRLADAQRRSAVEVLADTEPSPARRRSKGVDAAQSSLFPAVSGTRTTESAAVLGTRSILSIPATGLSVLDRCPRQFAWTYVEPLPRRPGRAAARGVDVHQRIAARLLGDKGVETVARPWNDGSPGDADPDGKGSGDADRERDRDAVGPAARRGRGAALRSFERSPWATRVATDVELPFAAEINGLTLQGRLDARFDIEDSTWLVDWKSGAAPASDDRSTEVQLDVYGTVATLQWGVDPNHLRTAAVYLGGTEPVERSRVWSPDVAAAATGRLHALVDVVHAGRFATRPGPACAWCDFRAVCPDADR